VIDTSQGRTGKLHAIKLQNLVETDLANLIGMVRSLNNKNGRLIYDMFKSSPYSVGKRNYRTYTPEKIGTVNRISVGQPALGTIRVKVGSSILYGVDHGKYVAVTIDDYPKIIREIKSVGYEIFYEGTREKPEPVVMEFFNILNAFDDTFITSKLNYTSWDIEMDTGEDAFRTILPLFGPAYDDLLKNINSGIEQQNVSGKTLLDVLLMSAKPGGWIKTANADIIKQVVNMAEPAVASELHEYLNTKYSDAVLREFHALGQKYAFADFEGLPTDTEIAQLQIKANKARDIRLYDFMKTKSGIYFAGSGHVDLIKKLKR